MVTKKRSQKLILKRKTPFSFCVTQAMHDRLAQLAEEEERSISDIARECIRMGLVVRDRQRTQEGE